MFYVIKFVRPDALGSTYEGTVIISRGNFRFAVDTLNKAQRFDTVSGALTHLCTAQIAPTILGARIALIRVEETEVPGKETRRFLLDCEGCREGETVRFGLWNTRYSFFEETAGGIVLLYTRPDAEKRYAEHAEKRYAQLNSTEFWTIQRVAVSVEPPKVIFTETEVS